MARPPNSGGNILFGSSIFDSAQRAHNLVLDAGTLGNVTLGSVALDGTLSRSQPASLTILSADNVTETAADTVPATSESETSPPSGLERSASRPLAM